MADKSFEWRMQGMVYACKMAKEHGIEYLEKDIKRRGVLKLENLDDDYNFLFRFDIKPHITEDGETTGYELVLCFMQQRHGKFSPVIILSISENDMPEIEEWLNGRWDYMKQIWSEFSNK